MNTPKIYIAGPISGYENLNAPAFKTMQGMLTGIGFTAYNPHEFCAHIKAECPSDPKYYAEGIRQLTECTDIILLDGWQYSSGARVEREVAHLLKLGIHEEIESLIKKYTHQLY